MRLIHTLLALAVLCGGASPALGQLAQVPAAGHPGAPTVAARSDAERALLDRVQSGELLLAPRGFEENKGQVVTTDGQPAPFVRYRLSQGGTNIFLLDGGIAYQFSRTHLPDGYAELRMKKVRNAAEETRFAKLGAEARLETYRMDMVLEGADTHAPITVEGRSADYTNYYNHPGSTPDANSGAGQAALDVRTYDKVVYHDVYPGIDWAVAITEKGFAYDFILRPGADPDRIKLHFTDQEELMVDADGNLIHGNRLGRFTEQRPVSYQNEVVVPTRFAMEGDLLSFELGEYDRTRELTIDPPRLWGTYYGGTLDEQAQGVAVDASGNVYLAGWTKSTSGIATAGAHDETWSAEDDAMLVKFDPNGTRLWGTYFGSTDGDAFAYCAVDGSNNIYCGGISKSPAGVATIDAHQTAWGGDWDGLLAKFNTSGELQWATYYGGTLEDRVRSCAVDGAGNAYITGFSFSTGAGVIASGAGVHQPSYGGGSTGQSYSRGDAFLAKFNSAGVRQWGTYYGGASDDEAMDCATFGNNTVYIAGGTGTSTGTSIATAGAHQINFGSGGSDAFLAKFNGSGVRQWGTYLGGSSSDYGFGCATDGTGNVFLTGDTYSTNDTTIATLGSHQTTLGGGRDAFLEKFNPANGARLWGTYYGGAAGESGRGCQADAAGNSYLIGETESSTGIAFNGHQNTFGGAPDDAYLARFLPAGTRDFGTYYGGTDRDNGYHCAVDASGNIYLVGETLSDNAIGSGGYQNTRSGGFDAFLVKFGDVVDCEGTVNGTALPGTACTDENACTTGDTWSAACACTGTPVPGPVMGTVGSNSPICLNGNLNLTSTATGAGTISYSWTGPNSFGSLSQNPSIANATVAATGTYTVTASNGCGTPGTGNTSVVVNTPPNAGTNGSLAVCSNGASVNLSSSLGGSPQAGGAWTFGGNAHAATYDPATDGPGAYLYTVTGTAPCPNASATVTVTENTAPTAGTNGTLAICSNSAAANLFSSLGGSPQAGGAWTFGGNAHATTYDPATDASGVYTYTVTGTAPCANATATVTVTESAPPSAGTNGTLAICSNSAAANLFASLGGSPQTGGAWTFGGNAHAATYDPATDVSGVYTFTVTGTTPCANATATVTVTESVAPNAGTNGTLGICSSSAAANLFASLGGSPQAGGAWTFGGNAHAATYDPATDASGVYTYTVTGTAPCVNATATVTVTESAAASAGTNGTLALCSNSAAADLFTSLGGSPQAGGAWTFSGNAHSATYTPATDGPGVYTYTVTGTAPCANATATVTVSENTAPNAGTNGTLAICSNSAAVNLLTSLGGSPQAGGAWSFGGNAHATTYEPATDGPGVYTYTVTGTAPCTTATATVTVTEIPAPNAGTNGTLITCSNAAASNLFSSLGGSPQTGGAWTLGGNAHSATYTPATDGPGIYTYTVTGTAPCAIATATVTVTENAAPNAGTNGTLAICSNAAAANLVNSLGGSPQAGGAWTFGGNAHGSTYNPATDASGVYTYTVTGTAPCVNASATVTVTENAAANAGTNGTLALCSNSAAANLFSSLGGSPQAGGNWTFGGNAHSAAYTPATDGPGIYTYTVTGTAPCTNATATVTVTENAAASAGANGTLTICSNAASVNLFNSLGGAPQTGGAWTLGGNAHSATYNPATDVPGVYTYTVTGIVPCANATATVTVTETTATTWYQDADADGAGDPAVTLSACAQPNGYVANNTDGCPTDPLKTAPGVCGCGIADTDNDADGLANCVDNCPNVAGQQGSTCNDNNVCTINDILNASCVCTGTFQDTDGDGVCNANDNCPNVTGQQGSPCNDNNICTINDALNASCICTGTFQDTDGDGTCNANDGCPNDPNKIAPGQCGCGVADTDTDGDGTANCVDPCPALANIEPGDACNDNNALTINDQYNASCVCVGTVVACAVNGDCNDNDPCTSNACVANACVYTPLPDGDGDGICDAQDGCPADPNKIAPGVCGCNVADTDTDGDGAADCIDPCTALANTVPGDACNDNNALTINDQFNATCVCIGTSVACVVNGDCNDNDPCTSNACVANACVYTPLPDGDGDGVCDAQDGCPTDPNKIAPGVCGCNVADTDTDGDGAADCIDACPALANIEPGDACNDNNALTINDQYNATCVCVGTTVGCVVNGDCNDNDPCTSNACVANACVYTPLPDGDGDGVCDAQDGCPTDPIKIAPGACGCNVADTDSDGDGTADCIDPCPALPNIIPGDACNDNNALTIDDEYNSACVCIGNVVGCVVAGDCDDQDLCTSDDCVANACVYTPLPDGDGDGTCDAQDGCPNDPDKIAPGVCGCNVSDADTDGDGLADCIDPCPALADLVPGDGCDDGNALTINDAINEVCLCIGDGVGCVVAGDCDDENPCTIDDCVANACVFTPLPDSDGDGTCDDLDGCPNDPEKLEPGICGCGVPDTDTDGDGLADCIDPCPILANVEPGDACDDGDPLTINDEISSNCLCLGDAVNCVTVTDCDDQDPCTIDDCVANQCTHTPAAIGLINGPEWVLGGADTTWSIATIPGATAYVWAMPTGWTSSNTTQPTINATAGSIGGDVQLCVTVYLSTCALDTCLDIHVSAVGIADTELVTAPWYTVRPNPSEGTFQLTRNDNGTEPVRLSVVDALGRIVLAPSFPAGQRVSTLDLGDASPGVYLLRMMRGSDTQLLRLMIRR